MQTPAPGGTVPGFEAPVPAEPAQLPTVRARRRPPIPLLVVASGVGVAMALPAVYLVIRSSEAGLAGVADIVTGDRAVGLLVRTSLLAVAVTVSAVAVGVLLAWLTVRTDLPARRLWVVLTALPLAIPSFIGGFAFVAALGPRGLVQRWLEPLGVDRLPNLYGFPGAWLVLTLFTYPYVLLTVRAALRGLDPALEEASRALGLSPRGTFVGVVLPQLRPAVTGGALLAGLYTLSDFGAVSLLRFDSFTRAIYVQYQASFDRVPAAALALMLVALTGVVLTLEIRARGRTAYHRVHGGAPRPAPLVRLGRWRWPAAGLCGLVVVLGLGVPVGVIGYWLARGLQAGESLRLTVEAAAHSLEASALGAVAALVVAWPVAHLAARYPGRAASVIERCGYVGYALPGVVVALSLVFFGARLAPAVYQTRWMLVFAYVVLFLPVAVGALRPSLLQLSPSLEEASRALGRGRLATLARVGVPLVGPGALAALALVFLTVMKELPATLLLSPAGFPTLATQVWSAANAAFFARAAAPALALVVLSSIPLAAFVLRERG